MKRLLLRTVLVLCFLCACHRHAETLEFTVGNESVVVEKNQASVAIGNDAANRSLVLITLRDDIAGRLHKVTSRHVGDSMSLRIGDIFELKNIPINESFLPKTLHLAVGSEQDAQRIVDMWGCREF
jgi:hypothetical protein